MSKIPLSVLLILVIIAGCSFANNQKADSPDKKYFVKEQGNIKVINSDFPQRINRYNLTNITFNEARLIINNMGQKNTSNRTQNYSLGFKKFKGIYKKGKEKLIVTFIKTDEKYGLYFSLLSNYNRYVKKNLQGDNLFVDFSTSKEAFWFTDKFFDLIYFTSPKSPENPPVESSFVQVNKDFLNGLMDDFPVSANQTNAFEHLERYYFINDESYPILEKSFSSFSFADKEGRPTQEVMAVHYLPELGRNFQVIIKNALKDYELEYYEKKKTVDVKGHKLYYNNESGVIYWKHNKQTIFIKAGIYTEKLLNSDFLVKYLDKYNPE